MGIIQFQEEIVCLSVRLAGSDIRYTINRKGPNGKNENDRQNTNIGTKLR